MRPQKGYKQAKGLQFSDLGGIWGVATGKNVTIFLPENKTCWGEIT
jgi:hypothetical protein